MNTQEWVDQVGCKAEEIVMAQEAKAQGDPLEDHEADSEGFEDEDATEVEPQTQREKMVQNLQ